MSDAFSARAWQRWQPDDLGSTFKVAEELPQEEPAVDVEMSAEAEQQQMRKDAQTQGYSEGYQKGFAESQQNGYDAGFQQGLADAQQQQAPLQARMQQLVTEFHHTLEALDSVIASRLMQLALEAARTVIGQATQVDGTAL
ncbi:FliH/SctL family protein, partial [Serratia sp. Se-PFBMAAmG]|nr:FliH/SctL family protein [Serratia sp. Se-PFBMAAmG]